MFSEQRFVDVLSRGDLELVRNVELSDMFEPKKKYSFDFVVLTPYSVYPFFVLDFESLDGVEKSVSNMFSKRYGDIDYILSVFKNRFYIKQKINKVFVLKSVPDSSKMSFAEGAQGQYALVSWTVDVGKVEFISLGELEQTLCSERDYGFSEDEYDRLLMNLQRAGSDLFESFSSQQRFIKKNNEWVPIFSEDSEKVFRLALLGGAFGAHRFYMKMYGSGILYVLTFGLFGVGWFFDCLEILMGCWKKKGKRLMPLNNKRKHTVEFAICCGLLLSVLFFLLQ